MELFERKIADLGIRYHYSDDHVRPIGSGSLHTSAAHLCTSHPRATDMPYWRKLRVVERTI